MHFEYNESVFLTIKNYNKQMGLSMFIHDEVSIKSH